MSAALKSTVFGLALAAAVLATERRSPVLAHHGGGVEYFMDQTRGPVTGVVTGFAFTFPHPYIEFDVKDGTGNIQKWSAVFQPTPTALREAGWTRDSVKKGDTLVVSGPPHKTAQNVLFARRVEINGKLLPQGD
jgi:hypothetical protein